MKSRECGTVEHETASLCPECLARVPAHVVVRQGTVWLLSQCPEHGSFEAILEEVADWYARRHEYDKPGTDTLRETAVAQGCPYDCGICPAHEQHTCIAVLEVTNACDLSCPVCYASSGTGEPQPLERLKAMMDAYVAAEGGAAEILQISGGEPTTHPEILGILQAARERPIKYVMLNTNGIRIATDDDFVDALAELVGSFEIYLQFDGFDPEATRTLRGRDLVATKLRAIERLAEREVPVTLVATVAEGINDHEVGRIAGFGIETPGVRGVNFQPLAAFGRGAEDPGPRRVTLSGVLARLEKQTGGLLRMDDFVPLPCDVERVAITLLYRQGKGFTPITRRADFRRQLPLIANTMAFDMRDVINGAVRGLRDGAGLCNCLSFVGRLLPVAPPRFTFRSKASRARFVTENVFRITVTSFLDRFTFEDRAMRKECVHVLTPDGRRIPFSAFNMLHRPDADTSEVESALSEEGAR